MDVGARALDFIERIEPLTTADDILNSLLAIITEFGLTSFCISGLPEPGESLREYVLLSGWPTGWLERYIAEDYVHVDPVIRQLKRTVTPFQWDEALYDPGNEPNAHRVMTEATEFRMNSGVTVPIYSVTGFQACVTYGSAERKLDLSNRSVAALHLISIYAHNKMRDVLAGSGNRAAKRATALSAREIEVLKWMAAGKTNWEIARIIGVTERTVEFHVSQALRRLNAVTRTQAVAEAFRAKVIT
jgi:LuxR family quorum sensing-dependent transcriptional regulator